MAPRVYATKEYECVCKGWEKCKSRINNADLLKCRAGRGNPGAAFCLWLTCWLEDAPLTFNLLLLPTAVALLRRACSWSNSRSSRRWVKASFCWMAIRNREFRVFFSSSAAPSCRCMSSSWITYSSHLREREGKEREERVRERKERKRRESARGKGRNRRYALFPAGGAVFLRLLPLSHVLSIPQTAFSRWEKEVWLADSQKYYIRRFPQCIVSLSDRRTLIERSYVGKFWIIL